MPRIVGDGGRRNVRRYVWKRSSGEKPKSRYVLQQRQAANDWACIPQSRRGFEEADPLEEDRKAAPVRRPGRSRVPHRAYDYEDHYYEADESSDDDYYEPDDRIPTARSDPARYRPAAMLNLRTLAAALVIMLAAVFGGMLAEGQFGLLSALVAGMTSSAAAVAGWVALAPPLSLVGGAIAILIGSWMIAKALRLYRAGYDEPAPRRRVMVSKETLDRYF